MVIIWIEEIALLHTLKMEKETVITAGSIVYRIIIITLIRWVDNLFYF